MVSVMWSVCCGQLCSFLNRLVSSGLCNVVCLLWSAVVRLLWSAMVLSVHRLVSSGLCGLVRVLWSAVVCLLWSYLCAGWSRVGSVVRSVSCGLQWSVSRGLCSVVRIVRSAVVRLLCCGLGGKLCAVCLWRSFGLA